MTPADLAEIEAAIDDVVSSTATAEHHEADDSIPTGICSVCEIRKRLTDGGNVKLHKRHEVVCSGSLLPPRPVKVRPCTENWSRVRRDAIARDGRCRKCGATSDLQAHHVHERVFGGPDTTGNLITLCGSCHAEWTYAEPPETVMTFERWLTIPPAALLIAIWNTTWPEDKSAAEFKREAIAMLRSCGRHPHP